MRQTEPVVLPFSSFFLLLFASPSITVHPVFHGTRDASAPEMRVAFGDLFQVLLVMVLSIVEALPLQDLCGNATVALFIQLLATKEKYRVNCF